MFTAIRNALFGRKILVGEFDGVFAFKEYYQHISGIRDQASINSTCYLYENSKTGKRSYGYVLDSIKPSHLSAASAYKDPTVETWVKNGNRKKLEENRKVTWYNNDGTIVGNSGSDDK